MYSSNGNLIKSHTIQIPLGHRVDSRHWLLAHKAIRDIFTLHEHLFLKLNSIQLGLSLNENETYSFVYENIRMIFFYIWR